MAPGLQGLATACGRPAANWEGDLELNPHLPQMKETPRAIVEETRLLLPRLQPWPLPPYFTT